MELGHELALWTILPFVALLACIAILPLAAGHWWEHHRNKGLVAALLALPLARYLLGAFGHRGVHVLVEQARDYLSFNLLLGALYVVTGGIQLRGSLSGAPLLNTVFLGLGALIANVIGTTGASMLLVRPLLRANRPRERKAHVFVFFIFVVSNCGGLLTPLGDPPLFLGFLRGVPFEWTLGLWKEWLLVNGLLLLIFNVWDQVVFNREEHERPGSQLEEVLRLEPLRVSGLHNLLYLVALVALVFAAGRGIGTGGGAWPWGLQEGAMLALAGLAYVTTPAEVRTGNGFSFGPIIEVAVLFAGIFVTMAPALLILNARGADLGLHHPWHFFWASGALSSFLDNAPTYLTFASAAAGLAGVPIEGRYLAAFLAHGSADVALLAAVSCGSVFMGANTYIGNGPNFMVKAIAEEAGVRMPSFFGYMLYSGGVLLPIFGVVTLMFFL